MNNNNLFKTKVISTAAAILSADRQVQIYDIQPDELDGKFFIFLTPYDLAYKSYQNLVNGKLTVNAQENIENVKLIKSRIFGRRTYGK